MDSLWDINEMMKAWETMTDLLLEEPGKGEDGNCHLLFLGHIYIKLYFLAPKQIFYLIIIIISVLEPVFLYRSLPRRRPLHSERF